MIFLVHWQSRKRTVCQRFHVAAHVVVCWQDGATSLCNWSTSDPLQNGDGRAGQRGTFPVHTSTNYPLISTAGHFKERKKGVEKKTNVKEKQEINRERNTKRKMFKEK